MPRHHLDRDFATGYQAPQVSARERQLTAAQFDSTRCSLKVVSGYSPRLFVADPDLGDDLGDTDEHVMDLTLAHYRPARRKG
jgi:hypothetical protein